MNRNTFNRCLQEQRFLELFIELEWNKSKGDLYLTIDEVEYTFSYIAEMRGFRIITCQVENIPSTADCKRIDTRLRPSAQDYILIYYIKNSEHQKWVIPVRNVDKRDIVTIEYQTAAQADFLFNKLEGINMDGITNIADVKASVQQVFSVNSEKITKDFFREFKNEHKAFLSMITGLDDHIADKNNRNKDWYTSVMLNRLMFCYFIQKKGFLDGNVDYLHEKLRYMQDIGRDKFFGSFYRGFLCSLFHDGLNSPRHQEDFRAKYGRIPYLNGGMFDEHQLEHEYKDIDIKDEAFERLFTFFDKWNWHLDTRLTASGKDINPDVLGYIFEQYINDRAAMGAYYTKEDITEYIGKNCILPFLMDKVKVACPKDFTADGYVWQTLRTSGDNYIYDAVKKGHSADWKQRIPEYIANGIDTSNPNLLERRERWNEKTSEEFALPTEIWRETVERLQRCDTLINKIQSGEITEINDFITYNLDIRQFVYDLLLNTKDNTYVENFYDALQKVTILDPTCGSGAFLFAAMNILEPLYEVCIDRMEEWNRQDSNLCKRQLNEVNRRYRSNRQYFIYKSIILRNLYGVDIMVEATEIAKLRLFLKMVAVVEVNMQAENLGLDPLPDIDFNIRCGNTLVGYATEAELNRDLKFAKDIFEDISNQEFKEKIDIEMEKTSMTYKQFQQVQFNQEEDMKRFKEAKNQLRSRLTVLNDMLNQKMHSAIAGGNVKFDDWKASHQPFHWLAEFYQIIHGNGGFDVIIGNPPYVEYNNEKFKYKVNGYKTGNCGNLYAFCIERSSIILHNRSMMSLITPMALLATKRMNSARRIIVENSNLTVYYNLAGDWHPGRLFEGVRSMFTIFISSINKGNKTNNIYTSDYMRWYTEERHLLFKSKLVLCNNYEITDNLTFPRMGNVLEKQIINKMNSNFSISNYCLGGKGKMYYRNAGLAYYQIAINFKQKFEINGIPGTSSTLKYITCTNQATANVITCAFNSNLFSLLYYMFSDCYHLTSGDITRFKLSNIDENSLQSICKELMYSINNNSFFKTTYYKSKGEVKYQEFYPRLSKKYIDEIDKVLAKHYGFTEEELDFIINYDIKYRMGDNLNDEE